MVDSTATSLSVGSGGHCSCPVPPVGFTVRSLADRVQACAGSGLVSASVTSGGMIAISSSVDENPLFWSLGHCGYSAAPAMVGTPSQAVSDLLGTPSQTVPVIVGMPFQVALPLFGVPSQAFLAMG